MKAARFDYLRPGDVGQALAALAQRRGQRQAVGRRPIARSHVEPPARASVASRRRVTARSAGARGGTGPSLAHRRGRHPFPDRRHARPARRRRNAVRGGGRHRLSGDPQPRHHRRQRWRMPTRRRIGRWRSRRLAQPSTSGVSAVSRAIPVEQFVLGAFTTALRDDEIIETIEVPKLSRAGRYGYYKFCRKTGEFAEASAAAVFDPESGAARIYSRRRFARRLSRLWRWHGASPRRENPPPRNKPSLRRSPTWPAISMPSSGAWRRPP